MNVPRSSPRPQHPPSQTHPNFRVSHVGRHAAGGKPPARAHERARARGLDALVSPLIPPFVISATITDFVMMGRGRRAGTSREGTRVVAASAWRYITRPRKRARTRARFRGLRVSPRARESHRVTSSYIELNRVTPCILPIINDKYVLAINIIVVLLACDDSLRELRNVRTPHRR